MVETLNLLFPRKHLRSKIWHMSNYIANLRFFEIVTCIVYSGDFFNINL